MTTDPRSFNAPLTLATARRLVELTNPEPESTALDVGCGRGELLALWLEAGGGSVHGVDPLASETDLARQRLTPFRGRAHVHTSNYDVAVLPANFDVAFCIGATHAFGGAGVAFRAALEGLRERVRPGGRVLVGEGYWKQSPDPAYLAATGMSASDLVSHAENHAVGEALGLRTLYVTAATQSEWDDFEAGSGLAAERKLDADPDDPDLQRSIEQRRAWRRSYLTWGRDTFGFGYYLFEVPA